MIPVQINQPISEKIEERIDDIKSTWNSGYLDGDVPDYILKQMIDMSYELVLKSLSKKIHKDIIGGNKID